MINNKKVVLVGCGAVGTSFVYSAVNQGIANDYVLIDVFKDAAEGNEMDIADTQAVLPDSFNSIKAGDYSDCKDAALIVITAGRPQKPGETRLEMVADNAKIMKEIATQIKKSGFKGITLIASNPVDVLTYVYQSVTGFDKKRVISSGTTLDSARLRRLLAVKLGVMPKAVQAFLLGEHGDSSVAAWSRGYIFGKSIEEYIKEGSITKEDLEEVKDEATNLAYKIIEKKRVTNYGIGACLAKIAKTILNDELKMMMVGAYLDGEYGNKDIYTSVPCILGKNGIEEIVKWDIAEEEQKLLTNSCDRLREALDTAKAAIK
ncbi:L-lactate dehydrogenase [Spiroplasma floricola]|uniref:L-lactate dehydrogenase n=1 Tax=Spiroplasma floricola 23-6 TaxID=1336749 RepID=A0A2K8SF48_9MOLU|nr:L-lactate dehydrogenase [Spiroplasma floricola]AUB32053.1 L-lactate dehydrogenase [Spiroplasma floricola 23-6]